MGIGYAPNKELYNEHFLKPLRSAFSERDLQVIIDFDNDDEHELQVIIDLEDDNHNYFMIIMMGRRWA